MNRYNLIILAGHTHWSESVTADYFYNTTSSSASSGFYSFYLKGELVACYPIEKTIIKNIEPNTQENES